MNSLPEPTDPSWGAPALPAWVTEWRSHQLEAIGQAVEAYNSGARVVFLDGPTGAGKTLIAEAVRRLLRARATYVCSTISLQTQFALDFPYAAVIKGRSNYPTADHPERFGDRFDSLTAADCTREITDLPACDGCPPDEYEEDTLHCSWCHPVNACNYERAKALALASSLSVLNTTYLLYEANGPGLFSQRSFVVADEADMLESELMGYVEVRISDRWKRKLGMGNPAKKTVALSWAEWIEKEALPKLAHFRGKLPMDPTTPAQLREARYVADLAGRLRFLQKSVTDGNWVYGGRGEEIVFRPVRVDQYGYQNLWRHGSKFLAMSATLIDPGELVQSLGLPEPGGENGGHYPWATVRVPMTFPKENRRIHVVPVASMTFKNKEAAWPQMAEAVAAVMERHPTDRILVHTVSYDLAGYLHERLPRGRTFVYSSSKERQSTLDAFKATEGGVMLAPSLDRGVDLPHDLCRVVVVAKVPFPNLGDPQVSARLHSPGGDLWYRVQAVRSLVQMTGRGVRSREDWCVSYIFDEQFLSNVYAKSKRLLPTWWIEALDFSMSMSKLKEGLHARA